MNAERKIALSWLMIFAIAGAVIVAVFGAHRLGELCQPRIQAEPEIEVIR